MGSPVASTTREPLTGDGVIDAMTSGYRWTLDDTRTIDWTVTNGASGERWQDEFETEHWVSEMLQSISAYANVKFELVINGAYIATPAAAAAAGSEINISVAGVGPYLTSASQWATGFSPAASMEAQYGYAGAPGDIFLQVNNVIDRVGAYLAGDAGWGRLMHELGHALGLKDPGDTSAARPDLASIGLQGLTQPWLTMMAYPDSSDDAFQTPWRPAGPMVLDVLALQYLYGKNTTSFAGDTTMQLYSGDNYQWTYWDPSGRDTVTAAEALEGWTIRLPSLRLSSLVDTLTGYATPIGSVEFHPDFAPTFAWLMGDIENAIGSAFSDDIVGNALANRLIGNGGADTIDGGGGNDTLEGGAGVDRLIGGAGADRFVLAADGGADQIDFSGADGDTLALANGAAGASGRLTWFQSTGQLSWDPDNDGAQAAVALASTSGGAGLTRASLADGFQPGSIRILLSNGVQTDLVFDWSSTNSVNTIKTIYTSIGGVEVYEVTYDDGASALRYNDLSNAADWSSRVVDTDGQGRMTAYSVTHDDGSRSLFIFDVANKMFYSRLIEEYDALGRMSQQAAASDDGTAYERHFDTYDTQPWAYYHDSYRADGLLISHTYYNADGSVYAG